jgi:hypothetical protein
VSFGDAAPQALLVCRGSGMARIVSSRVGSTSAARHHQGRRPEASQLLETAIVSFNRGGAILGHPRITYESENASDNDRLQYRIAVMEALQRCTPLPFTEALGSAVAGRPFAVPFRNRKYPPKTDEKRAWLIQKIL